MKTSTNTQFTPTYAVREGDLYVQSNLEGRLRNTTLPYKHGLIPLFEAVVNSIHAIEERFDDTEHSPSRGKIRIDVERENQTKLIESPGKQPEPPIVGFRVTDNGIGFTSNNWASFNLLDSTHKIDKGCRGIGRLMWLKAFSRVHVMSTFHEGDYTCFRDFTFSKNQGVLGGKEPLRASDTDNPRTVIELIGFSSLYAAAVFKTTPTIARALLEHCLWYFVRDGGVPEITICDGDEIVNLFDVFDEHMHSEASTTSFSIKDQRFDATHVKFRASSGRRHSISYCAGGRLVKEENTPPIPGLTASIYDDKGTFAYACYLCGPLLDERAFEQRIGFDIEEEVSGLFADHDVSLSEIRSAVAGEIVSFLGSSLDENRKAGADRLDHFVSTKAPQYRPILNHIQNEQLSIDPEASDKDLDLILHKRRYALEESVRAEGYEVLSPRSNETSENYKGRISDYLSKLQDIKQADLASYVAHRRVVLDLFREALNRRSDGSVAAEEVVHDLIAPLRQTSDDEEFRVNNLWLVDERLSFHSEYLGSDKTLNSVPNTGNTESRRPDIVSINCYGNPHAFSDRKGASQAAITVVEIKKPLRNDYADGESDNPIDQALGYLQRLRNGKAKTRQGRPIPNANNLPGFVYVLADLTDSLKLRCQLAGLTAAHDGMRYFGHNPNFNAYIEVIDFDGLVEAAVQRNSAFFDRLGLPSSN